MKLLSKSSRTVYKNADKVIKLETHINPLSSWQNKNEFNFFNLVKTTKFAAWVPEAYSLSDDNQLIELEYVDEPITMGDLEIIRKSTFFAYCVNQGLHVRDLVMQDAWRKQGNQFKLVDAGCLDSEFR
jgi:hypothetical protein